MNPTPNWIDRVELVHLGFDLWELRIGSRVMGNHPSYRHDWVASHELLRDFSARNGGAL